MSGTACGNASSDPSAPLLPGTADMCPACSRRHRRAYPDQYERIIEDRQRQDPDLEGSTMAYCTLHLAYDFEERRYLTYLTHWLVTPQAFFARTVSVRLRHVVVWPRKTAEGLASLMGGDISTHLDLEQC